MGLIFAPVLIMTILKYLKLDITNVSEIIRIVELFQIFQQNMICWYWVPLEKKLLFLFYLEQGKINLP